MITKTCPINLGHSAMATSLANEHKLFGRCEEITQLLDALEVMRGGRGQLLLLPGLSGTGKTSLAHVLREPTRAHNGFFLEGKFNQYDRNVAYVAWRQALATFCAVICREEESTRQKWAADILHAVEGNGQLLIDLVPEFETLLGKQSPVDAISPQEARHRFVRVIRQTLQVICQPEHPLVLFIDDWQWADPASLHLLTQLQIDSTLRYVLIVAAYRDDEVDDRHEFATTLDELRSQQAPIRTTEVRNLSVADIESLVNDQLSAPPEVRRDVAVAIRRVSRGNAFFAYSLVETIRSTDMASALLLLADESEIGRRLPVNVVDVFHSRIEQLDYDTQELLSLAACLGHRFNLETLAMISERTIEHCDSLLASAGELILALSEEGGDESIVRKPTTWRQFAHDCVQQAAYSRIPMEDMPAIRLGIAHTMLSQWKGEQLAEQVCEVVEHFNAGAQKTSDPAELVRGVELNVAAARKARAATAYRAALQYQRAAQELLGTPELSALCWSDHHRLAMDLCLEQAECEFLEGDRKEAQRLVRIAVERARTPIQKAEALTTLIVQHTLQAQYADAIAIGREALAALDMHLPENHYASARDSEIEKMRARMCGRTIDEVIKLPVATDATMQTAAKVLIAMGPPCYRAHQKLWSVIVPRVVNLTLEHGRIPQIGYSHTAL